MAKQTKDTESERKLFKDWFDRSAAEALAKQLSNVTKDFPTKRFVKLATKDLEGLEFAGRVKQFSSAMRDVLPDNVDLALGMIRDSFPEPLPDCESVTDGWLQWPVGQFIADYGLEHFDDSMLTMVELTQRFSSEFAVRPFMHHQQKETIAYLKNLVDHPSPHVRRWCSEGTRPRLPWGRKLNQLIENPKPVLPILDALRADEERYVRRSVANNLNDIAKDHPSLVIGKCETWMRKKANHTDEVVKHALRSLVKDGDPGALKALGFRKPDKLRCSITTDKSKLALGEAIELTATIESESKRSQDLIVDYVVHYVRKNGVVSEKVFKWKNTEMPAGDVFKLKKKQSFKQTTVRALYPGTHQVELQINGERVASTSVKLI